ncbi:MAG: FmdB family zinc ribbon protein [Actinomycetota bacterium]
MPTYDYRCDLTGEMFEIWQSFSEDPIEDCPTCDGKLTKVYSNVGIAFKGDGFYKNDHGSGSKPSESSKTTDSTSASGSSEGGSSSGSSSSSSSDTSSSSSSSD